MLKSSALAPESYSSKTRNSLFDSRVTQQSVSPIGTEQAEAWRDCRERCGRTLGKRGQEFHAKCHRGANNRAID